MPGQVDPDPVFVWNVAHTVLTRVARMSKTDRRFCSRAVPLNFRLMNGLLVFLVLPKLVSVGGIPDLDLQRAEPNECMKLVRPASCLFQLSHTSAGVGSCNTAILLERGNGINLLLRSATAARTLLLCPRHAKLGAPSSRAGTRLFVTVACSDTKQQQQQRRRRAGSGGGRVGAMPDLREIKTVEGLLEAVHPMLEPVPRLRAADAVRLLNRIKQLQPPPRRTHRLGGAGEGDAAVRQVVECCMEIVLDRMGELDPKHLALALNALQDGGAVGGGGTAARLKELGHAAGRHLSMLLHSRASRFSTRAPPHRG